MAKVEPRKITTAPNVSSPSGEQHFVDKHFPGSVEQSGDYKQYSPNDRFLDPDNGIFDVGKGKSAEEKVKIFDRMANHFGYDQKTSIEKYDENVNLDDRLKNAHKKTRIRNFFDKKGDWKGASTQYRTNKEAKKDHKKVIIVKEESNFKKITSRIRKKEGYPKKSKKINENLINESGTREWAMNQIMFPNSQGQGHCDGHCNHPLHDCITRNNFKYSHTTPIGSLGKENEYYLHHTYANGEHKVGVDDRHPDHWESKTSSASGHRTTGNGAESLDKHLSWKVKKYKLQPVMVNEEKMNNEKEIDKKSNKVDKVKNFIKKLKDKKD